MIDRPTPLEPEGNRPIQWSPQKNWRPDPLMANPAPGVIGRIGRACIPTGEDRLLTERPGKAEQSLAAEPEGEKLVRLRRVCPLAYGELLNVRPR